MAEEKKNGVFLNRVSEKMIHEAQGAKGPFYNVNFDWKDSTTGFASVSVRPAQVMECKDKNGTVLEGKKNILLGDPGTKREISVKQADGSFAKVEVTVEQIKEAFDNARAEYRKSQKKA